VGRFERVTRFEADTVGGTPGRAGLVLLHGFTNTGACWQPVLSAGAGERYRPITPDIRGHGTASERVPVTLEAVLGDIAALAPEGRDRFTLAGYSMGGRIALHAALAMPERIDRLVLIGASPGLADAAEREARLRADEQLASEFESSTIDELASRWARSPVLAGLPLATAAVARADRLRNTPGGLARALRGLGTGALPSLWGRLGELPMPVTLAAGERDEKFIAIAGQMQALIREADVTVIPDAGHAAHLENPAAVAGLM
jgi:2-succinyl-6-hydroxy-2,4-cyclohexadiene-1-carboxylate synthase